ncbi:MAG: ATP-binding cassette domain-containing protein [Bryobacteraceae bacterium]|nr:ATP-binding cassette domain-containing protein [Bryobacteraceae bacterium]
MSGSSNPVELNEVDFFFGQRELRKQVLRQIRLTVCAGEILILTGPSGSGKTTLLTLIGALRSAEHGSVRVLGTELTGSQEKTLVHVRRHIGFVFQNHNLLKFLTAAQNVRMSAELDGSSRESVEADVVEMLAQVGLADQVHKFPDQMSGGQKQRVAIARALVTRPSLVLADEPTASLDSKSGREVVNLLHDLARKRGSAIVMVTHDNRVLDIADRTLHMEDGVLCAPF